MTTVAPTPSPAAMCPAHPQAAAVASCARCGRFVCELCAGEQSLCPACEQQRLRSVPASTGRASVAVVFLGACAAGDVLSLLVDAWTMASPDLSDPRALVEGLAAMVSLFAFFGAGISYLMWLHRAVRQVNSWGEEIGFTPGWAVGWWFIPFANLVKPFQVVRGLVLAVGGQRLADSLALNGWWAAWLIGNGLSNVQGRVSVRESMQGAAPSGAHVLGIAASVLGIVGALLCLRIVRRVQLGIDARRNAEPRG